MDQESRADTDSVEAKQPVRRAAQYPNLEIIFGQEAGKRYPLTAAKVVVGRGDDADFVVEDLTVSRQHFAVHHDDGTGELTLVELGSVNGTRVNGERQERAILAPGTTIEAGATIFMVKVGEKFMPVLPGPGMRDHDTRKLAALSAESVPFEPKASHPSIAPQSSMKRSRGSSSRSPFFIQAVSWLVVLALVSGGLMLILTMLDTSGPLGAISEADISSLSIPRRPPALPVVTPPDKKRNKEESLLAELPVEEAPDVAVERYHEAQDARDEGDLVTAVKILSDIADKYPEFMPPDRISLVEQRLVLEKRIAFTGLMRWAEEVLSAENPDADRLENLLQELSTIPSTDEEFGEVAITLTERANLQLKELENTADGSSEQVPEEHNDVTKDAVENGKVKDDGVAEGSEVVKAEPELSAQDVAAGLLANVKNYYSVGDFIRVKRTVAEYIKKSDSAEVKEVLETALADIEEFGRRYSEGLELVRKPLKNQEAIEELGVALAIDRKVFGTYQHKLKESLAQLHAEVASEYLEDGRYRDARHHLDIAKNFDNGARDVAQLGNLFSYRAAALLRQSRKETDAKAGMRALEQALLLSEKGSSIEKEALNLLQEMTAQKIEESPDSLK